MFLKILPEVLGFNMFGFVEIRSHFVDKFPGFFR